MLLTIEDIQDASAAYQQRATHRQALMEELDKEKIKYDRDAIILIEKMRDKIIFLERGKDNAGYKHILRHQPEFAQHRISVATLPMTLFGALRKQSIVGYQGKGKGRPIYQSDETGIAITVGSNGFMVSANPTTKGRK